MINKAAKVEAGYGSSQRGFSCGVCRHYRAGRCNLVEGYIRKQDCCNLFSSKGYQPSLVEFPKKKHLKEIS